MLKEIFDKQRDYLNYFFNSIDLQSVEKLLNVLLECKGVLFFSGVGKSGLVARKIAFTMVSTGTRAFYLSPTDAVHGDLGMVSSSDAFIMLSKSGETDELIHLIPAIRNKGARVIGLVCQPHSRLSMCCDMTVTLPFQHELCPFDMAPTMSTASQLLLGDLITIALMRNKNFSLNQYALNHPSGQIGKRITLKVKDLMLKRERVPFCHPQDKLGDVLIELSNKRCGCILIVDEEFKLQGIFTDGDLRRTLQNKRENVLDICMKDLMTYSPRSVGPDSLAWDAMKEMERSHESRIMVLPVVDFSQTVLGLLHLHDLIQSGL